LKTDRQKEREKEKEGSKTAGKYRTTIQNHTHDTTTNTANTLQHPPPPPFTHESKHNLPQQLRQEHCAVDPNLLPLHGLHVLKLPQVDPCKEAELSVTLHAFQLMTMTMD
jgi:hypothetical protein